MPQIVIHKDAIPVKEGSRNDFCYIIIKGEFQVRKKIPAQRPTQDQSYKEFLNGVTAKRSIRGIFNKRIGHLTHKRNLTSDKTLLKEEDIFTLSEGQIFGEERFCEIVATKDQESRNNKLDEQRSSIEIQKERTAPFTIKCLSSQAEVFKISNFDVLNMLKKDQLTKAAIFNNYKKKRQLFIQKSSNMHMDLKFATNMGPTDEVLDDELE